MFALISRFRPARYPPVTSRDAGVAEPGRAYGLRAASSGAGQVSRVLSRYLSLLPPPDPAWHPDVQHVVRFLHTYLFEAELNSAEAIKQACGIRDRFFGARFSFGVGTSLKRYVNVHRIRAGKLVMLETDASLTHIALALGYGNQAAFTMAFKREEGCTPSAFQRQAHLFNGSVKEDVKQPRRGLF